MSKNTSREGKIRLYDGTGTPYYLELDLDPADFSAPIGAPRQEEILVLDRGRASSDMHYIKGPDDKLMGPVPVTFSATITDAAQTTYLLDWLAAMNDGLSTTVNSNTLVSTESDTQRDGSNNNPAFADSNKSTCDIHYLLNNAGTDVGWKYMECYIPLDQVQLSESEDGVTVSINAMCYGTIVRISSWVSGTSVEA